MKRGVMSRLFVNQIKENDVVSETYRVAEKALRPNKNGVGREVGRASAEKRQNLRRRSGGRRRRLQVLERVEVRARAARDGAR